MINYKEAFIAISASDFDRLVRYYQQLLEQSPKPYIANVYAEFQLKGLKLGIFRPKDSHQQEFANSIGSGMSLCLELDDLENAIARLTEIGYPPPGKISIASHGREIYAYDPAGNRLILHQKEVSIALRPATIADLDLLRHWDEQPHVIASDPNDDWGWEVELNRNPDWREQLIAELGDRPIAFVQIIDPAREDSHYWGDVATDLRAIDIWIGEATDLGKGYGTKIMQLAIARCFADPNVRAILIDPLASNTRACRFYERLGFQFVEQRRFGDDDCFVYRLNRTNWF